MEKVILLLNFLRFKLFLKSSGFFYINSFPIIKGIRGIQLGKNFYANRFLRIEVLGLNENCKLRIGNNVSLGESVHIASSNSITIKDNVLMGSRILITDHNHGLYKGDNVSDPNLAPQQREIFSEGGVVIEENVWLGDGVVVLPNVTIGKSSIIGANSVVTMDIPMYSIAAGIPAKVLKLYNFQSQKWEKP